MELRFPPGRRVTGPPGNLVGRAMAGLPPGDALALAAAWHARGGSFSRPAAAGLYAALEAQSPDAARSLDYARAARELRVISTVCAGRGPLPQRYAGALLALLLVAVNSAGGGRLVGISALQRALKTRRSAARLAAAAERAPPASAEAAAGDGDGDDDGDDGDVASMVAAEPAFEPTPKGVDALLTALAGTPARCFAWRGVAFWGRFVQALAHWRLLVAVDAGRQGAVAVITAAHAMWVAGVPCKWVPPLTDALSSACLGVLRQAPAGTRELKHAAAAAGALAWCGGGGERDVRAAVEALNAGLAVPVGAGAWVSSNSLSLCTASSCGQWVAPENQQQAARTTAQLTYCLFTSSPPPPPSARHPTPTDPQFVASMATSLAALGYRHHAAAAAAPSDAFATLLDEGLRRLKERGAMSPHVTAQWLTGLAGMAPPGGVPPQRRPELLRALEAALARGTADAPAWAADDGAADGGAGEEDDGDDGAGADGGGGSGGRTGRPRAPAAWRENDVVAVVEALPALGIETYGARARGFGRHARRQSRR